MIRIIENHNKKDSEFSIEIDGELIENVIVTNEENVISITTYYKSVPKIFFEQKIIDIFSISNEGKIVVAINSFAEELMPKEVKELFLDKSIFFNNSNDNQGKSEVSLIFKKEKNENIIASINSISFLINYSWKNPFSIKEYIGLLRTNIFNELGYNIDNDEVIAGISLPLPDSNLSLLEAVQYSVDKFKSYHTTVFEKLSKDNTNSLETRFSNFPEEVRIPCEQYLLYFSEFLRDLGISATTDIRHEAGEVLFSVTPTDPDQALDKIRVALEIFLNLPKSEIVITPDEEFEIAMLKAKANIDHFNSQLSLAKAEIRVKEREIQALEATLETKDISIEFLREKLNQQKRLLEGEIAEGIIDIEPKPKKEDKVEFLDGVFAITQIEEKGFRVNLAQLYRKLRIYLKGE